DSCQHLVVGNENASPRFPAWSHAHKPNLTPLFQDVIFGARVVEIRIACADRWQSVILRHKTWGIFSNYFSGSCHARASHGRVPDRENLPFVAITLANVEIR